MTVGIIGAGKIGRALGKHLARSGHEVVLSNSRGPQSLAPVVAELGPNAKAGSVAEGAARRVVFFSGDDAKAKAEVSALIDGLGFAPVDLGGLVEGGRMQQAGAPLAGLNLLRLS